MHIYIRQVAPKRSPDVEFIGGSKYYPSTAG